ncbi:class F sortase [Isoptericola sp. S6320L]|uniref:class F sortase n=1 Tax=Isoptericola sp. S6320L TaxID=2926411 RepID=UPI001FF37CB6|nr:class F sortase [Isoptericola sp. S6320L]MCK0115570.1 class F sortase [Isoptericola sp. S6320L]
MTTGRRGAAGRASRPVRRTAAAALVAAAAVAAGAALTAAGDDGSTVGAQIPRTTPVAQPSAEPARDRDTSATPGPTASAQALPDVPVVDAGPDAGAPAPVPDRLQVRGLLDVPVRPVGVDPDGSMELPRSGDVAGWYRFGPAPADDAGTVVLASHVDTIDGVGAFAGLTSVEVGDVVVVTDEAGERHEYTVSTIERFSKEVVPLESIFDRAGERRLALVTCGGRWDAEAGHYEDNLVVTAAA